MVSETHFGSVKVLDKSVYLPTTNVEIPDMSCETRSLILR